MQSEEKRFSGDEFNISQRGKSMIPLLNQDGILKEKLSLQSFGQRGGAVICCAVLWRRRMSIRTEISTHREGMGTLL